MENLFKKIFGAVQKGVQTVRAPFTATVLDRFNTGNYSGALQNKNYLDEFRNWVYPCVDIRSESLGNIKLKLMKAGEQVFDHPMLDVLNRVNDGMTRHELFKYTQAFKDLHGNAFWYLARAGTDGKGDIQEIYILKPDKVRIILDKTNPIKIAGYLYTQPDGQTIPFTPEEILHHRAFNPKAIHPFPHLGMGIVEAAAYAIDTDNSARSWNLNFFRNGARPDGLLITDGEGAMDSSEFKRLKEEWNEEHKGEANAHKISVLSGGIKYQELTRTQKDMDFPAQRTMSRDEIFSMFRVPKILAGITDDANRANADASIYVYSMFTLTPLMQQLIDTLNEFFVPSFGDESLSFEFVSPVQEDRAQILDEYVAGYNVWLSRNDIRRREGLPVTENGEQILTSTLLAASDTTTPPDTQKTMTRKTAKKIREEKKNKTIAEEAVDTFVARLPESNSVKGLKGKKGMNEKEKMDFITSWNKRFETNTQPLKRKLRSYFASQEKEVQKNLKDEMKGLDAKEFQYKSLEDILFDEANAMSTGINLITPFIAQYIRESGNAGNDAAHGDGFNADDPKVKDFIPKRAEFFAKSINDTTSQDLLASIQEGIANTESLSQISQRVSDVYQQAQDYRTDRIARTEVAASSNFGSQQAYLQAGIEDQQWVVVDPKDEDCLENDGVVVKIGDAFPSGDDTPPIHPNCQCTTVPVFDN